MLIDFVEIRNFRRLAMIRIDFSKDTTLFVGANNSGKTSAITALRYFLIQQKDFSVHDIPLAQWAHINELGRSLEKDDGQGAPCKWKDLLPSLDIWLKISENEIHHVSQLIPTLDWRPEEGIGVRLQLEPKEPAEFARLYLKAKRAAVETLDKEKAVRKHERAEHSEENGKSKGFALWPDDLIDFLRKRMTGLLTVNAYLLDPSKRAAPQKGVAQPQKLPDDAEPLEENPFKKLIRIDEVPAQRGFSDYSGNPREGVDPDQDERKQKQLLTAQLRSYYGKHLDPLKAPEPSDIRALRAIHEAQTIFDERLKNCFQSPLCELEQLGYPGVANPRLIISTALRPVEGLKHQSAVQYDVAPMQDESTASLHRLPEQCNGLGYQNLISMVFRLISFRDDWLKVGKAAETEEESERGNSRPPLHLVLLEEPEAHLHVQVQQVFIRKALDVLRNHPDLQNGSPLSTQLVVSTHSGHIAHEVDFADMRYFRRHPARNQEETPTSTVVNLSEVFGQPDETAKFASRYLQATHAELFFADGAIMLEGASERMLIPHFIRSKYEKLHSCYITLLEVGGSHAHRLRPLIEHLGLNTLIITDIDAVDGSTHKKAVPRVGECLVSANNVLNAWHPNTESIDKLLALDEKDKEKKYDESFKMRVAYQTKLRLSADEKMESGDVFPRTFEDALALQNIKLFRNIGGTGLIKKFRSAIESNKNTKNLHDELLKALDGATKAEFALDLLYYEDPESIQVPEYIRNGLEWLQDILIQRQQEVLATQGEDGRGLE